MCHGKSYCFDSYQTLRFIGLSGVYQRSRGSSLITVLDSLLRPENLVFQIATFVDPVEQGESSPYNTWLLPIVRVSFVAS